MQTLQIDPEFQSLIPPLAEDERAGLEASLIAEGCRDALVVWAGQGVIVDGHNRYAICQAHNIPFEVKEHTFEDRDAAKEWIIRNQFARRNLNTFQRGELADTLRQVIAARARSQQGARTDLLSNLTEGPIDTRKELAAAAGVSQGTMYYVQSVVRDAPEPVKVAARAGDISTHRAYKITEALKELPESDRARAAEVCIDHDEKARILARLHKSQATDPDSNGTYEEVLRTGGFHYGKELEQWCDFAKEDVSAVERALKNLANHHAALAAQEKRNNAPPLPEGVYNVIYADPPWEYHNSGFHQSAEHKYPTMPTEDICAMPIGERADKDAVLFLWATSPKLAEAIRVIEAWGFEYKVCMVWRKNRAPGIAFWLNTYHELLLIASRGSFRPMWLPDSVIDAPVSQHSKKPERFYEIIEAMYPGGTYLELFARDTRDGWQSFGNELDGKGDDGDAQLAKAA